MMGFGYTEYGGLVSSKVEMSRGWLFYKLQFFRSLWHRRKLDNFELKDMGGRSCEHSAEDDGNLEGSSLGQLASVVTSHLCPKAAINDM